MQCPGRRGRIGGLGIAASALAVLALLLAGLGWWRCWFLCDDAYINFRYVANAHAGHGLVWNPAPFLPVEGYTSFLWVVLLWLVWDVTGIEPPDSSNIMLLLCGLGTLLLLGRTVARLGGERRLGPVVGAVAMLACASNRSFVTFMSSGLETALFVLLLSWWVAQLLRPERAHAWLAWVSLLASLTALTRPDGILCVLATLVLAMVRQMQGLRRGELVQLLPLLPWLVHLGWRRWFYGEWLPNTYYAKVVANWPESGLRYLGCFLFEHGSVVCLLLLVPWLLQQTWRRRTALLLQIWKRPAEAAAVTVLLAHAGYYTWVVGGDHFEYRVFCHLVPWQACLVAVTAARLWPRHGRRAAVAALLLLAAAGGFGWYHAQLTRAEGAAGFVALAPRAPVWLQPLLLPFDRAQAWLQLRKVCVRRDEHVAFLRRQQLMIPSRGLLPDAGVLPIAALGAVGYAGWSLPEAAIIDRLGLNDWVVARGPLTRPVAPSVEVLRGMHERGDRNRDGWLDLDELVAVESQLVGEVQDTAIARCFASMLLGLGACSRPDALSLDETVRLANGLAGLRSMAHERRPPRGYIEALEPNVVVAAGQVRVLPRQRPFDAATIRRVEAEWRARLLGGAR